MTSEVFFAGLNAEKKHEGLIPKLRKLGEMVGLSDIVGEGELVAVKLHFGEPGNTGFLRPIYVSPIVDALLEAGAKPFLTDANTLYRGERSNARDHLMAAARHGFTYPAVNAPLVIADGLNGKDYWEEEVGLKHFEKVKFGTAAYHAHALVGLAHFKGHMVTGFGGAIKNIGMGFGSRAGKQQMHSELKPFVNEEKCVACRTCQKWCPVDAIAVEEKASIDQDRCIGCAECTISCPTGAIAVNWESSSKSVQERMVEYTYGVLKNKAGKCAFFNFIIDVTPDCDCLPWSDEPIHPDVGVVASRDIVAVDRASVDLVTKGGDVFRKVRDIDWKVQLDYAEEIGLGSQDYELVSI